MTRTMERKYRVTLSTSLVMVSGLITGCAGAPGLFGSADTAPPFRDATMSMQTAKELVVNGLTTKADVMSGLGSATIVKFESGYEVWVYRAGARESSAGKPELVILFTPSGVVKKHRLKPAYTTP